MKQTNDAGPRGEYHFHDAERMRFVVGASGLNLELFARWLGLRGSVRIRRVLLGHARLAPDLARLVHARLPPVDLGGLKPGAVRGSPAPAAARGSGGERGCGRLAVVACRVSLGGGAGGGGPGEGRVAPGR